MNRSRSRVVPRPTYGLQAHQLAHPLVVVEERRDPEAPPRLGMIRGAKRIGMHDRLAAEGLLSREACAAGTRYAQLAELSRLGLTQDPDTMRAKTAPHSRTSAAEVYVAALEQIAAADAILGMRGRCMVQMVVCDGVEPLEVYRRLWPDAVPVAERIARNRIAGALSSYLERLSDRWPETDMDDYG